MNSNFLTMYATLNVVLWTVYLTFFFFDKNMNYSFIWKEIHQRKQTTTGRKTTNNNTPLSSMYPRAHKYSCACILKFWTFFSCSLATFFKFPIIGHKGILVGSFLGEGLLVGFRLGDLWALEKDIWKPIPHHWEHLGNTRVHNKGGRWARRARQSIITLVLHWQHNWPAT